MLNDQDKARLAAMFFFMDCSSIAFIPSGYEFVYDTATKILKDLQIIQS